MVKPKLESWTIVLAGQWNTKVFSPQWVAQQLFNSETMRVEVAMMPSAGAAIRYLWRDLNLMPADDQLIIAVKNTDNATLERAEKLATTILTLLPHTPIVAVGVNFEFEIEPPPEGVTALFQFSDLGRLAEFHGAQITRTDIQRTIQIAEQTVNLKHSYADNACSIHFNFHRDTPTSVAARGAIDGRVLSLKSSALELLATVYDLVPTTGVLNGSADSNVADSN